MSGVEVVPAAFIEAGKFSYGHLPPDAAQVARTAADAIRMVQAGFLREVGTHLLRVKAALPYGAFTAWAEAELGITQRTAQNYMAVAHWLDGKSETLSYLPSTVLYALSAPTAPAEVVQAVVDAAAAGEALDARAINTRLLNAKQETSELKAAQRRNPKVTQAVLKARKERRHRHHAAEDERHAAEAAKAKQAREDRVRPLAIAIATLGQDRVAELLDVLFRWNDIPALMDMLRKIEP